MPGYVNVGSGLTIWDLRETIERIAEFHRVTISIDWEVRHVPGRTLWLSIVAKEVFPVKDGMDVARLSGPKYWHLEWPLNDLTPDRYFSFLYRCLLEMDSKLSLARWNQLNLFDG